jgi:hypothetical protein
LRIPNPTYNGSGIYDLDFVGAVSFPKIKSIVLGSGILSGVKNNVLFRALNLELSPTLEETYEIYRAPQNHKIIKYTTRFGKGFITILEKNQDGKIFFKVARICYNTDPGAITGVDLPPTNLKRCHEDGTQSGAKFLGCLASDDDGIQLDYPYTPDPTQIPLLKFKDASVTLLGGSDYYTEENIITRNCQPCPPQFARCKSTDLIQANSLRKYQYSTLALGEVCAEGYVGLPPIADTSTYKFLETFKLVGLNSPDFIHTYFHLKYCYKLAPEGKFAKDHDTILDCPITNCASCGSPINRQLTLWSRNSGAPITYCKVCPAGFEPFDTLSKI